jgi:hypothetical protein
MKVALLFTVLDGHLLGDLRNYCVLPNWEEGEKQRSQKHC